MDGRKQLPAEEIRVHIHVERAIGRMKSFSILKHTIPITPAGLSSQIICVCAYLLNFKPVLVPPHESTMDQDDDSNSDVSDLGDSDDKQVTQ